MKARKLKELGIVEANALSIELETLLFATYAETQRMAKKYNTDEMELFRFFTRRSLEAALSDHAYKLKGVKDNEKKENSNQKTSNAHRDQTDRPGKG